MENTPKDPAAAVPPAPEPPASPHIRARGPSSREIMRDVVLALLPAAAGSVYLFGAMVIPYYFISIGCAAAADWAWRRLVRRQAYRFDWSPAVTGMLLAMSLPAAVPYWFPAAGAVIAIIAAKELFGGIGRNFLNPAIAGRGLLRILFVTEMTRNVFPRPEVPFQAAADAVTGATPLYLLKAGEALDGGRLLASFLGTTGGKIGETSALLLLLGGAYLAARKVIRLRIPLCMLGTIAVTAWIFGGPEGMFSADHRIVLGHVLGGASVIGAFFMATDYSSSPSDPRAQCLFAAGCGLVTMLFRFWSGYPEGFTFALLIMNCTVPVMNRFIVPAVPGEDGLSCDP